MSIEPSPVVAPPCARLRDGALYTLALAAVLQCRRSGSRFGRSEQRVKVGHETDTAGGTTVTNVGGESTESRLGMVCAAAMDDGWVASGPWQPEYMLNAVCRACGRRFD